MAPTDDSISALPWSADQVLPDEWVRSYWQRSVGDEPLLHHGREKPLVERADVVIIGSGLSGATTAYNLLRNSARPRTVVCLEARELCSGASGRNAGHCRPDAFRGFADYAKLHGSEEAKTILHSERATLNKVAHFVGEHDIECELVLRPTIDLILSKEFETYIDDSFEGARQAGVDVSNVQRLGEKATRELTGSPIALGAYTWPAASVHPLKLCLGVHRLCMKAEGYELYTHCPVTSVKPTSSLAAGQEGQWAVNTARGTIVADKVVFATNAYTQLLLPELEGIIQPSGIHAAKLSPPSAGKAHIDPTMSLRFNLNRFYSVAGQPDDSIILGMGPQMRSEGTMNDSAPNDMIETDLFGSIREVLPELGYAADSEGRPQPNQGGFEYSWMGIVAFTPDKVPLVGPIPDKDGLYIIAGMGGHGMARIFHCAPTLSSIMLGGDWDESLPRCFQATQERLETFTKSE